MDSVLIVGDFRRLDLHYLARAASKKYRVYFLELDIQTNPMNTAFKKYGQELRIQDFVNGFDILKSLNIVKVFFFSFVNIHEVLFNLVCKQISIPTIHVEHGVRDFDVTLNLNKLNKSRETSSVKIQIQSFIYKLRHCRELMHLRRFDRQTFESLSSDLKSFYKEYHDIRIKNNFLDTCMLINNPLRNPNRYISFSEVIFRFHRIKDHLDDQAQVDFIGFPQFDDLLDLDESNDRELLYIDQPFVEKSQFGWNTEFRKRLIQDIHDKIAKKFNYILKIKPHPTSDQSFFKSLESELERVKIIDAKEIYSNDIVLGFASTLLIPLAAQKNTICFSLDMHPDIDFNYSAFLTNNEAIKQVSSIGDLMEEMDNLTALSQIQKRAKHLFIEEWMHIHDGNSFKRLLDVI